MAQIAIPRLPQAPEDYDPSQVNSMINTIDLLIQILNTSYTPEQLRSEEEALSWFLSQMANSYKKVLTTISGTGDATVYTVPAVTTTLLKTAWVYNNSGGDANLTLKINSTAISTDATVGDKDTKSFFYLASGDIGVLEEGDLLKVNTDVQPLNVYLSLVEIS